MTTITKEQLIEELKASTQNAGGMFEISEDTICALMSMLTNAATQLPQPAVASVPNAANGVIDPDDPEYSDGYRVGWNACRAAMLHRSEPETDNTTQQFESLGRGDK